MWVFHNKIGKHMKSFVVLQKTGPGLLFCFVLDKLLKGKTIAIKSKLLRQPCYLRSKFETLSEKIVIKSF